MRLIISLGLVLVAAASAAAQPKIPNGNLRVTVQQKEDGKTDKGLHVLELSCWDGQCSLTSVSLNQCGESGSGRLAFYPKVQISSTRAGNLKVRNVGNTLVVEETGSDIGGDYTNNLRFEYEPPGKDGITSHLIGFSGGFVKNSVILKKVLTIQYIPLPKQNQIVNLDCGVLLPGIDSH